MQNSITSREEAAKNKLIFKRIYNENILDNSPVKDFDINAYLGIADNELKAWEDFEAIVYTGEMLTL